MAEIEIDASDLIRGAEDAADAVLRGIIRGMDKSLTTIKRDAVLLCPVDTGRLRQSMTKSLTVTSDEAEGVVGTNTEYAPYVEFGTGLRGAASNPTYDGEVVQHSPGWKGQTAQPFLRPAFYNNQDRVNDNIAKAVGDELSKMK